MSLFLLAIVCGTLVNLAVAMRFYFVIRNRRSRSLPIEHQQNAAIVLAVRGCDPTLPKTISGLLNQNFRDYRVVVVVDSLEDPAWSMLKQIQFDSDQKNRMTIQPMDPPRTTCSLKCNAIIGATESLPPTTQWVALVDADVDVHPDWLSDLLGPLLDPKVCVTTGQQWFEPGNRNSKGALLRSIWNAGAMVPSVLLNHAWAGTMAVRYEDLIVSTLIDDWKTSIVDDGPMLNFSKQMGGSIFVVPKLLMVNREDCSLPFAVSWISRMLTWSRIYESTFWITVVHASISGGLVGAWCLLLLLSVVTLNWNLLAGVLISGLLAAAALTTGYCIVRRSVDVSLSRRKLPTLRQTKRLSWKDLSLVAGVMGPVQLIYLYACIKAQQATQVRWRGIDYRIEGERVEMVKYQPFSGELEQEGNRSI